MPDDITKVFNMNKISTFIYEDDFIINGFFNENRFLSNFYPAVVSLNGITFGSVEAAYQAAKCGNYEEFAKFESYSSQKAKQQGKLVTIRPDWDSIKFDIMTMLVEQKFHRNRELLKQLINTGNKALIEANQWRDRYWGVYYRLTDNGKWTNFGGENNLGRILMSTRDKLIKV